MDVKLVILILILLIQLAQFVGGIWVKSEIEKSIESKYAKILEDYRFQLKTREQATKIAEYISLAKVLKEDSKPEDYRRANQLAEELFLWLPEDVYKELVKGWRKGNPLSALIPARRFLLGDQAGTLGADDFIWHAPGIGKENRKEKPHLN